MYPPRLFIAITIPPIPIPSKQSAGFAYQCAIKFNECSHWLNFGGASEKFK